MPLNTNAGFLSEDQLGKFIIEDAPKRFQMAKLLPYMGIDGDEYVINPLDGGTLPVAPPVSAGAAASDQTSNVDEAQRKYGLDLYATNYQIQYYYQDRLTYPNDMDAVQSADAARRLLYGFYAAFSTAIAGSTYLDPSNLVSIDGPFAFDDLNAAYHKITVNGGRPNAIMSSADVQRIYLTACMNAGFLPQYIDMEMPDPIQGRVRVPFLALHGTPWFINDFMPTENANRIYCMVLGDDGAAGTGRGLTAIIPRRNVGNMFVRRESTPNSQFIRVDYTFPVGVSIGSFGALSAYDFVIE